MTLKLKSTTNELWTGWKLAWFHHLTHIACSKKLRGLRQNWMHFVYKMDNLFRSIRVSDENSSVTKGFYFFELLWTPDFLCVQNAPFKATSSIFYPFWIHLVLFMHLLIFWAKWPWNWKAQQMNSEKVERWHGIIISPT